MKTLCVLGSINVDHVIRVPYFPKAGETLTGYGYQIAYGGKGANQAVAAARLGANVKFIGTIGSDQIGQAMKTAFEQDGIDTSAIQTIPNQSTGLAMIQVSDEGENSIVISAGSKGVYVSEQGKSGETIAGFRVQAVDTTAAGDTFNGGLVTALLEGKSMREAIRFAHAAAAISVTRLGAQTAIPTRVETNDFLAEQ